MLISKRRGWEIPDRLATPEALVLGRRMALGGVVAAAIATTSGQAHAQFGGLFGGSKPAAPAQPLTPPISRRPPTITTTNSALRSQL